MMKNLSKIIYCIVMATLFLTACQGIQSSNKGMLVESSSIVMDKYIDKNGEHYIATENNASKKKVTKTKFQDEEVWARIELGDYITINHDKDVENM
ncbi:hypothetical protein ACFSTH_07090 [Paenibacillus yanchengensis]|uniref:DUF3221 domain-containing protein n=1 Tax=Paenibacillus yanchengensis TaxID=2035833 RepID=A0ABW4YHY6_9BACL